MRFASHGLLFFFGEPWFEPWFVEQRTSAHACLGTNVKRKFSAQTSSEHTLVTEFYLHFFFFLYEVSKLG